MQEIILECKKYARGKYLRIEFVTVEWDRERKAFAAMVMFHRTRDKYNLLYPVREETVIGIPEPGEEIRCISHTGYTHVRVEDLRKPTDCP